MKLLLLLPRDEKQVQAALCSVRFFGVNMGITRQMIQKGMLIGLYN